MITYKDTGREAEESLGIPKFSLYNFSDHVLCFIKEAKDEGISSEELVNKILSETRKMKGKEAETRLKVLAFFAIMHLISEFEKQDFLHGISKFLSKELGDEEKNKS